MPGSTNTASYSYQTELYTILEKKTQLHVTKSQYLSVAGCYMNLDLYNHNNSWLMTMIHLLNGLPSAASNSPATKTKNHTYNT